MIDPVEGIAVSVPRARPIRFEERMRWRRVILVVVPVAALSGLLFLGGCVSFYPPLSDAEISAQYGASSQWESQELLVGDRPFHYVAAGEEGNPLVVFIHGAPGAWDAFAGFLQRPELLSVARLISVDRPGYGRSGIGEPERSLAAQAAVLSRVFEHNAPNRGAILVGHSFGGPVAAKLAVDYPEAVDGVVFVAASVDPTLEETKWYQIPAHWKVLSWAVPKDLYSTNEEILPLADELRLLEAEWPIYQAPSIVIQGDQDQLVPKANADYLARMIDHVQPTIHRHPELNHFIPWSAPDLIVDAILELLAKSEGDDAPVPQQPEV